MSLEINPTAIAERRLRDELLRTYEEYSQLLIAIRDYLATYINRLLQAQTVDQQTG